MGLLLAVDPGIRGCGVACFDLSGTLGLPGGRLHWAKYARNPLTNGADVEAIRSMAREVAHRMRPLVEVLALEFPRVYPGPRQKGDQNDLFPLAGVVSAIAAGIPEAEVRTYYPRDWKGTVDPDVMIERVKGRLRPFELDMVELPGKALAHNVFDAIGIGLHALGRLEKKMVIAR